MRRGRAASRSASRGRSAARSRSASRGRAAARSRSASRARSQQGGIAALNLLTGGRTRARARSQQGGQANYYNPYSNMSDPAIIEGVQGK